MQPIAFCSRCRGMRVGCNRRYIVHCLICKKWLSQSAKLLVITVIASLLVLAFSSPGSLVFSDENSEEAIQEATVEAAGIGVENPAVMSIEGFLNRYKVDGGQLDRIASAIVTSGRKYDVDPFLIASIMIVESRANPFAISGKDAIGIMQIHLPTWGHRADEEGINLFKIEDNVEFGARILKDYVRQFGLWEGVKRYKGWNVGNPNSAQSVSEYVGKVQRIYANRRSEIAENLE
jgi:soluble lytic murein transglycosylase-like protein